MVDHDAIGSTVVAQDHLSRMRHDLAPFLRRLRIEERVGRWGQIWDCSGAPLAPGCYALLANDSALYIGQTSNLRSRLISHRWRVTKKGVDTQWGFIPEGVIKIRTSRRRGEHLMVEARLLERLSPQFNQRLIDQRRKSVGVNTLGMVPPPPIAEPPKLIPVEGVARYLGLSVERTRRLFRGYIAEAVLERDIDLALERAIRASARETNRSPIDPIIDYQI